MRKSFNSLQSVIRSAMHLNPLTGYLFVFKNKRADIIKCVFWDNSGYAMFYKVLQKGTFQFPDLEHVSSAGLEIEPATLHLILDGIDLSSVRHRQRYRLPHSLDQSNSFVSGAIQS